MNVEVDIGGFPRKSFTKPEHPPNLRTESRKIPYQWHLKNARQKFDSRPMLASPLHVIAFRHHKKQRTGVICGVCASKSVTHLGAIGSAHWLEACQDVLAVLHEDDTLSKHKRPNREETCCQRSDTSHGRNDHFYSLCRLSRAGISDAIFYGLRKTYLLLREELWTARGRSHAIILVEKVPLTHDTQSVAPVKAICGTMDVTQIVRTEGGHHLVSFRFRTSSVAIGVIQGEHRNVARETGTEPGVAHPRTS